MVMVSQLTTLMPFAEMIREGGDLIATRTGNGR